MYFTYDIQGLISTCPTNLHIYKLSKKLLRVFAGTSPIIALEFAEYRSCSVEHCTKIGTWRVT